MKILAEEIPVDETKISFTNNSNFLVDNEQAFSRQINKAFPIRGKDKICLALSLNFYKSVILVSKL